MSWKVTTQPASEPITLAEAKLWLKVDSTADNNLITALIESARLWVERHCNIGLLPQTITEVWDGWPAGREMELSVSPLRSVTGLYYLDSAGDVQQIASANYSYDIYAKPPRVQLKYSNTWPTLYDEINSVSAVYAVGYDSAATVPQTIKTAMYMAIADGYENRTDYVRKMPTMAEMLLQSSGNRIFTFK